MFNHYAFFDLKGDWAFDKIITNGNSAEFVSFAKPIWMNTFCGQDRP